MVLSWATRPPRQTRDAARARMMSDERLHMTMPFDGKRMIYGGFDKVPEA